jgi:hypothetical protein
LPALTPNAIINGLTPRSKQSQPKGAFTHKKLVIRNNDQT